MSVELGCRGPVLIVTIDRPAKRNAVNAEVTAGLEDAMDRLEADPGLRVGVLTGGGGFFSAGTDLREGSGVPSERGGHYGMVRRNRRKPLIAAVEGPAIGGGMELALACDMVVASRTAWFALPETRRGVVATAGALFRGPWSMPPNIALQMLIAGLELDAERAFQIGLVNHVAETGLALSDALTLAEEVCAASPIAVAETLQALSAQRAAAESVGWHCTEEAATRVHRSADYAEGVAAFLERRQPRWRQFEA